MQAFCWGEAQSFAKKRKAELQLHESVDADSTPRLSKRNKQYIPRKRSSKHLDELREINEEREEIINPVPPFTPAIIKSWSKFNAHKQKHHLKFGNFTHTHPTTRTQASLYLTTKTLPLDEQDLGDVKTLTDASVSSKHITNFLNERIGA
ncbi:hypothetical protein PHYSODRAFT_507707 [Phytophthora sojae]|uniref:Uncharacterized protein n=1 Tax=Phytophthora sojae (strain P6497) TaxID=1094619 RepID=G4ZK07_PHYSP|nr:hypothetical protein PHYSODRAFT_507707 [Phytophthora sojae]EGZ14489.1 hypothetical protein PHYSODRAFT_507707 [Phytophthora sojae]|eukprot:XP_009528238.1 hypothetical protein PHYSODRAFT_507707 [Phytophthora sojae]